MNIARSLFAALFAVALNSTTHAEVEDDEKAQTVAQMYRVWEAIMAFKKDHGQVPDYLSDLVPVYLPNADALVSPTEKRTGRHGDNNYADPKIRSSFCYEFSAAIFAGRGQTFRQVKEAQREEFGGVVPILRCFLFKRRLNVSYSGDVFETDLYWETAPEAQAVTARIGTGPGFANGEFTALTVVDAESGAPIADAEVRLTARVYHSLPLPDRLLRTAADGTVRVPLGPALPPSRRLTVTVVKPGYFAPPDLWREGKLPEEAVMGLERGATIGGIVKLDDGTALAGAQIEISPTGPDSTGKIVEMPSVRAVTGAEGRWSCAQLPRQFAAVGLRISHPAAWTTTVQAAEPTAPVKISRADLSASTAEIRLAPAAALHGIVTTPDGAPVVGAEVFAVAKSPPRAEGSNAHLHELPAPSATKTDAQGHYALPWRDDLPVALLVFPAVGAPTQAEVQGAREHPAQDIRLAPGRTIRGRIVDETGQPIRGAAVDLSAWNGADLPTPKIVAESDADGNFAWAAAPTETVTLRFSRDGFFARNLAVGATAQPLTIPMYRRARH